MKKTAGGVVEFDEALEIVLQHAGGLGRLTTEMQALLDCGGRVLGESLEADRDQPPFDRSTRDGFAVRAAEVAAAELRVAG
jgi:molybdopterin molybdotransferase